MFRHKVRMRRLPLFLLILCFGCAGAETVPLPDGSAGAADLGAEADLLPRSCTAASCAGCCLNDHCQPGTTLAACGKNAADCAVCQGLDACLPEQQCGLEPKKPWLLTIVNAEIDPLAPDGKAWDFPNGDPDPFIRYNNNVDSASVSDTLTPRWSYAITTTPEKLLAGIDSIEIWDEDLAASDLIAVSRRLQFSEAELRQGSADWQAWGRVLKLHFTLAPK
jgi:hypothetical protein